MWAQFLLFVCLLPPFISISLSCQKVKACQRRSMLFSLSYQSKVTSRAPHYARHSRRRVGINSDRIGGPSMLLFSPITEMVRSP
ncbi:hypothetical protein F4860DRAFT_487205 [Xylaria cubensis]|nr:hypothetical protein F4860DRAFT_487205 [Xylaria cubensis]